ncbi:MAG: hypothetical protein U0S50_12255 [Sphingopyxis sp.]|uniref:hypothetical protein n=1 Tax=Sphingopyxis sp. TaxID=1908224 RepID=UPI002ABD0D59|nr:hypothetical protein [Sphingopyxis sp.]MDZ3832568.1 hypothetical protein [Sphingopyxis sp.]
MAIDRLPRAPRAATRDACDWKQTEPRSAPGKQVAAAGWGVTNDLAVGRFQAVSFAGSFDPGTSGSCEIRDGNVAIFDGGHLIALAYVRRSTARSIGFAAPLEGGALRLWDGDILPQPLADIRISKARMTVGPVAAADRVCGGKAVVPNIYGQPINKARIALQAHGWTPVPGGTSINRTDPREAELARRGVPEVTGCSGTGFGFCAFEYQRQGATLSVTTAGEDMFPSVSAYNADCG